MKYTIAAPTESKKSKMSHLYMIVPNKLGAKVMYARTRQEAEEFVNFQLNKTS